jgi:tRNA threonylcarbamoyladenosine biosynthesis protein TsaB
MEGYILHIDTAGNRGLVMISQHGIPIATRVNTNAYDHAAFIQPAVKQLLEEVKINKSAIQCIAVANGPGSYTGLRVGLAAAKGLCYAWETPLLTLSSLSIMALAMQQAVKEDLKETGENVAFAPMIDARRMEVFFGLFGYPDENPIIKPVAAVIDEHFLAMELENLTIFFSGDGAPKWQSICSAPNAYFIPMPNIENAFAIYARSHMHRQDWANVAYSVPFYSKEFYSTAKQKAIDL